MLHNTRKGLQPRNVRGTDLLAFGPWDSVFSRTAFFSLEKTTKSGLVFFFLWNFVFSVSDHDPEHETSMFNRKDSHTNDKTMIKDAINAKG